MISIIIPTLNEAKNIGLLIPKIHDVLNGDYKYEVVLVDDNSPDGTARVASKLRKKYNVRIVIRKNNRGLASAVIHGFNVAKGNILCVMDADLSHPPQLLPKLIGALNNNDVAVGSRLVAGGGAESWPVHRRLVSWIAQGMAKPLTPINDAMSGYFAIKKDVVKKVDLKPFGYKILLEILVKGEYDSVEEIPFIFLNRSFGKSKIGVQVEIEYLKHLYHLYNYKFGIFNK